MHKLILTTLCLALLMLSGCSSTTRTYLDTLMLALKPGDGVSLSDQELASRDNDVLYVTVGSLPRALLVLAYTEFGQQKWVSADNALLVLENGRLVKTSGFGNNLLFLSDREKDPLKQSMVNIQSGQSWQSYTDWSERNETGYLQRYEIIDTFIEKIQIQGHQFDTKQVIERVTFFNGETAENLFWFELTSGQLLKSRQQLAPFWPQVELVHLSTAGRLTGVIKARSEK